MSLRMRFFLIVLFALILSACGKEDSVTYADHVVMSLGKNVTSLDPAIAADVPSQTLCAAFYDTLIQYAYLPGVYELQPAMLAEMPVLQKDGGSYLCTLRTDLFFQNAGILAGLPENERRVTSRDVAFSLLRLADARLNSPGYWVVRGNLTGIEDFHAETAKAQPGDFSPYDRGIPGIEIKDETHFLIRAPRANPRLLYLLALPYCSIVSRTAAEKNGSPALPETPCGSGPFVMADWNKDYSITLDRCSTFREEYFANAENPVDRKRRLPLTDRITCYLVTQSVSSWLMFLQGELDFYKLDDDHFQALVDKEQNLNAALRSRGIMLDRAPQLETNYIGFNFNDPVLGKNADLRKAISLAFNKNLRVLHSGGRFTAAYGVVPPGVDGFLADEKGPYGERDLERAKEYMVKAGYPGGKDPATGKPLVISFDQPGTDTVYQQHAEMMSNDLREIGIDVRTNLNTRPRFQAKLASGDVQMFRYSWVADYPDAENFFQLFYSENAGGCNRVCFSDPEYDRMYREILYLPASEERTAKYCAMSRYLLAQCPWIFETHTMDFVVRHAWMKNYFLHDFAFNRWKYFSAPVSERTKSRSEFKPLPMSELQ